MMHISRDQLIETLVSGGRWDDVVAEFRGMNTQQIESHLSELETILGWTFDNKTDLASAIEYEVAASVAAATLGSIRTEKKAASSRENGKLGGRPKKQTS